MEDNTVSAQDLLIGDPLEQIPFTPTTKRIRGFDPEYQGSQAIGVPDGWRGKLLDIGIYLQNNLDFPLGGTWFENTGDYLTDLAEGQEKSPLDNYLTSLFAYLDIAP